MSVEEEGDWFSRSTAGTGLDVLFLLSWAILSCCGGFVSPVCSEAPALDCGHYVAPLLFCCLILSMDEFLSKCVSEFEVERYVVLSKNPLSPLKIWQAAT